MDLFEEKPIKESWKQI